MEEILKLIIRVSEFSTDSSLSLMRQLLVVVYFLLLIEISLFLAQTNGFYYTNCEITANTIIQFFTSYTVMLSIIYLGFSIIVFRCLPMLGTLVLSLFIGSLLSLIPKNKDLLTFLFTAIRVVNKNGRQGKNYESFNTVYTEIVNDEKTLRFCDFLVSFFCALLFIYSSTVHASRYIPEWMDKTTYSLLWFVCAYWFFNVSVLKGAKHPKEDISAFLGKIKP